MMKQAQTIQRLVANHTQPATVLRAVTDYRTITQVYGSGSAHYSALLYCKHILQQVAEQAPAAERQAILESLQAIPVT
jgi:predicted metal-dependent HD superfamily phosphohydrolase